MNCHSKGYRLNATKLFHTIAIFDLYLRTKNNTMINIRKALLIALTPLLILAIETTMSAQNFCDSLQLEAVHVDPLAPESIGIHVTNNSSGIFSYPGFRIYYNDELVGEELVDFFGIGAWSVHNVPHTMQDLVPGQQYDLAIELWTGFYEEMVCSFNETVVLIPTDECHVINFWAAQSGDKQIIDPIIMELIDIDGIIVYSAFHEFSPDSPFFTEELCLEPGCYTGSFTTSDAVISADINFSFQSAETGGLVAVQAVAGDVFVTLPVNVWSNCGPTTVEEDSSGTKGLSLYPNPSSTILNFSQPLKGRVFDVHGNVVAVLNGLSALDVSTMTPGVYFMTTDQGASRFIVE
ncbi:MAG: hypothetical protein ACI84C_000971 [Flavobacteriales bacterium]|jgi:hypothetical protein